MRTTTGAPGARIVALGDYQPRRIVTNDDLARRIETNDEWIRERVGIVSRPFAEPDESIVDMAAEAAGKALAASGRTAADIDLVVVATCSMDAPMPTAAAELASRLGVDAPGAFDLNAACAGFSYSLGVVDSLIRTGTARTALAVGVEKMTDWIDPDDRSTAIIFADGAGAAVVTAAEEPGIGPVVWGSDGDKADLIRIADRRSFIRQEGQAVFRWATALAPVALAACEAAGVAPSELAAFVPHQANLRIVEALARKIGAPQAVVARDIVHAGNTSAASIPLALARMVERGDVPSGVPVLLLGFGAGLSYAGQVVTSP